MSEIKNSLQFKSQNKEYFQTTVYHESKGRTFILVRIDTQSTLITKVTKLEWIENKVHVQQNTRGQQDSRNTQSWKHSFETIPWKQKLMLQVFRNLHTLVETDCLRLFLNKFPILHHKQHNTTDVEKVDRFFNWIDKKKSTTKLHQAIDCTIACLHQQDKYDSRRDG